MIQEHHLPGGVPLLFSWLALLLPHQRIRPQDAALPSDPDPRQELVEAIVADRLPVRFQLQMHKFIWPPDQKGVLDRMTSCQTLDRFREFESPDVMFPDPDGTWPIVSGTRLAADRHHADGRRYVDLTAAFWRVAAAGHANPPWCGPRNDR